MANEKRLIDANALLEKMQYRLPKNDAVAELINECVEISRKQVMIAPTVDAVEVVRCKDCKHFIQEVHGCNYFGYYSHTPWVDEVDFCSYGERREGE